MSNCHVNRHNEALAENTSQYLGRQCWRQTGIFRAELLGLGFPQEIFISNSKQYPSIVEKEVVASTVK